MEAPWCCCEVAAAVMAARCSSFCRVTPVYNIVLAEALFVEALLVEAVARGRAGGDPLVAWGKPVGIGWRL